MIITCVRCGGKVAELLPDGRVLVLRDGAPIYLLFAGQVACAQRVRRAGGWGRCRTLNMVGVAVPFAVPV